MDAKLVEFRPPAKLREITVGEMICEKLYSLYFSTTPWAVCYALVAKKFSALKIIARKFYSDKSEIDMLIELNKYSIDDIADAFASST